MMKKILVIGGGGHSKVVINLIQKMRIYDILGYIDKKDCGSVLGISYLGNDEKLDAIIKDSPGCAAVLGIGYVEISSLRRELFNQLEEKGFHLPALVSPNAIVNQEVTVQEGTVVLDGCVIQPGAKIGKGVIINTCASIDHDCEIGDFSHIAPGVCLSGSVIVGEESILGTGSVARQRAHIGSKCVIGAGATVIKDCLESGIYIGTPAQKKKDF